MLLGKHAGYMHFLHEVCMVDVVPCGTVHEACQACLSSGRKLKSVEMSRTLSLSLSYEGTSESKELGLWPVWKKGTDPLYEE